jgi:phosphoglycolate phosphatase
MTTYKYIVFDFDGTIADSRDVFIALYNELALKHGYGQMTPQNLQQLRCMSIAQRCKLLKVPMYKVPFMASAVIKQFEASVPLLRFNDGMKELLQSLVDNNVKTAVLSSNSQKNIQQFFDIQGVAISEIFCSRSVFGKHVLINKFLKQKNLKPTEILYVGDELRDVIACQKSGVAMAWVSWGYDSIESLENNKPDYVIHNPAEILALAIDQKTTV